MTRGSNLSPRGSVSLEDHINVENCQSWSVKDLRNNATAQSGNQEVFQHKAFGYRENHIDSFED